MINLQENQDWILGGLVANVSYTEGFEAWRMSKGIPAQNLHHAS